MTFKFNEYLMQRRLAFCEDFVCVHHISPEIEGLTAETAIKQLAQKQFMAWHVIETIPAEPGLQPTKIGWSGKGKNLNDDLACSCLLQVYMTEVYVLNESMQNCDYGDNTIDRSKHRSAKRRKTG